MIVYAIILAFSLQNASAAKVVEETLATVNADPIYLGDYESNLSNVLEDMRKSTHAQPQAAQLADIRSKVLNQMVEDTLLLQEAKKAGIKVYEKDVDAGMSEIKARFKKDEQGRLLGEQEAAAAFDVELKRQRLSTEDFEQRIRKQLLVIRLIDTQIKSKIKPPTPDETGSFFEQVKALVAKGEMPRDASVEDKEDLLKLSQLLKDRIAERIRARHILIKFPPNASLADKSKALKEIKRVKTELDRSADFADLAKKYSEDSESARKGGDLGYFIRGWMEPQFEKAAFGLSVGKISEPVETSFGYHLIYVEEKRAASPLRLDDLDEDLTQYLFQSNFRKQLRAFIENLRSKATIKITKDVNVGVGKN